MKTYKTEKNRKIAYSLMDWEKRMYILIKRNQGWSVREIARKLDISTTRVHKVLQDIGKRSVSELEKEYQNWLLHSKEGASCK